MRRARHCIAGLALLGVLGVLAVPGPVLAASGDPGLAAKASSPRMTVAPLKPNGSGVLLSFRIDGVPEAGQPIAVLLDFDRLTDPAGATVQLRTEGGLALVDAADTSRTLAAGAATRWRVMVIPATGIGYLHVFTRQYGTTSATSVPVQVGRAAPVGAALRMKQTPAGEKIVPMPVK